MTDEERRALFDRLETAIDPEDEERLEAFRRFARVCEALPDAAHDEDPVNRATAQAVILAVTLTEVEYEGLEDLVSTAMLDIFDVHRQLRRVAGRQHEQRAS